MKSESPRKVSNGCTHHKSRREVLPKRVPRRGTSIEDNARSSWYQTEDISIKLWRTEDREVGAKRGTRLRIGHCGDSDTSPEYPDFCLPDFGLLQDLQQVVVLVGPGAKVRARSDRF